MEVLFENQYIKNKKVIKEVYRCLYFRSKALILAYIIMFLYLLKNILILFVHKTVDTYVLFCFILIVLILFAGYYYQVYIALKRDRELYGNEVLVRAIITDEYIQNSERNGSMCKLEYTNIKNAVQTKNLIVLRTKARLGYVFPKDTFTKGDAESFIYFLKGKGIKVK